MIKKNSIFKWGQDEYEAFNLIKQAMFNAPSLATPNFFDPFILYTFASDRSYAAILTKENQDKAEAPISFFSSNLKGVELNYSNVEKQAYVVFKAIKYFRPFLLKTHTKIIVPFQVVRNLLVQKDVGEKRANWVTPLQEYDVEIKPASIVKGQRFCKMLAGASLISKIPSTEIQMYKVSLNIVESLYADIIFFLKNGYAPPNLDYTKKRALRLKDKQCQLVNDVIFRMNYDYALLRCLEKYKAEKVLQELHDGPVGGHYAGDATAHKILCVGYYWPTLFKDAHSYIRKCQICQTTAGRQKKPSFPLQLVNIEQPFDQCGLDIIDRITQKASFGTSPFNFVYGKEVALPTHLAIPSLALVQYIDEAPNSSLQLRQLEILKLEEQREQAKITHAHHQALVKASFDSNMISRKDFQMGDLILKLDKAHEEKGKHTKFQQMWLGPFQIAEVIGPSTFMLQDLTGKRESLPVNGQILKKYFP
eukprot:PITA_05043